VWRKNTALLLSLPLMSALLSPGCATLTSRTSQQIPVTSQPPGAQIIVDGQDIGHTPLALGLRKKAPHLVRIEQEGYNPLEINIEPQKKGIGILATLGDAWLGIAVGIAGDYVVWLAQGKPDEEFGEANTGFFVGCIAGAVGLALLEKNSNARYWLTPRELSVTLTKADGPPRVDTVLVDAEEFQNVKWIRVHRDGASGQRASPRPSCRQSAINMM